MNVGDLVKMWSVEGEGNSIWLGLVIKVWERNGVRKHNTMCEVEWVEDHGRGLHFVDELVRICK